MTKERKSMPDDAPTGEQELQTRRDFLIGLGKWSKVVVAAAVLGSGLAQRDAAAAGWINRRGGGTGWLNNRSGGGWINSRGSGTGWLNSRGGGGWVNRRGGGGWLNARR